VKCEHNEDGCHLIPFAAETASGLKPQLWVGRMIEAYKTKGVTSGWVFRDDTGGAPACLRLLFLQVSARYTSSRGGC
jgi:hypothetical protein